VDIVFPIFSDRQVFSKTIVESVRSCVEISIRPAGYSDYLEALILCASAVQLGHLSP
jgi:hypothetical protein